MPLETKACKFCGAIVAVDADKKVAYHAKPTCERFREAIVAEGAVRGAEVRGVVTKLS